MMIGNSVETKSFLDPHGYVAEIDSRVRFLLETHEIALKKIKASSPNDFENLIGGLLDIIVRDTDSNQT
jgi:hypothetical protein